MRAELEARDSDMPKPRSKAKGDDTLEGGPLPDLDQVIARIPEKVKATMDELFRAQFESVRRVPAAVLKSEPKG